MKQATLELAYERAAELLKNARHGVAFTGAGISTPSGIPDFRSRSNSLWNRSDPMKVASLTSFRRTPQIFFDWLRPLACQISQAQPNPAHQALADLEQNGVLKAIITQNIDGLHQRAGSHTVLEVHGSMTTLTCPVCHACYPSADFFGPFIQDGTLPSCPDCQNTLKPDFVLFEEQLPIHIWNAAKQNSLAADVFLVAGSSLTVMPAAGLPTLAVENNAAIIVVNFTPTYLDESATVLIPGDVAEVLPRIANLVL
jgi:NAD-dependent deacetylase